MTAVIYSPALLTLQIKFLSPQEMGDLWPGCMRLLFHQPSSSACSLVSKSPSVFHCQVALVFLSHFMHLKSVRKHLLFMPEGVKTSGLCHIVTSMTLYPCEWKRRCGGNQTLELDFLWPGWRLIFQTACLLLINLSLPPSIQTVPKVQTFWWCSCPWQEQSCSSAWRLCSSGNCWSRSTTDESLPNLRKNGLLLSGTRSVNITWCSGSV